MPVNVCVVANAFIELAKNSEYDVSHMKLQKLVFIANGFHLAIFDEPLYYNDTAAWKWGPVVPFLYKKLKKYEAKPI